MGSVNTKVAYTAGFSALAGIIIFVLFGPKGTRPRNQKELQVRGLQNLGSTCYVSAVLQSLAACDHFRSFVETCFRRYNPVDTNGRTIINSKSQLFPLVSALHQACLLVNRRNRNGSNQAPQLQILRILSQLNYKLPRGSEQDSFELFGYLMSGVQEEQTKMVRESKGNDYTCLIPHDDGDTLVEVVVEKFHKDLVITSVEKICNNGASSSSSEPEKLIIDAAGDEGKKLNIVHEKKNEIQKSHLNLEGCKIPHLAHRLGYFHTLKKSNQMNPFIGSIASKLQCLTCMSQNAWCIEKFHGISLPLPSVRSDRISLGDLISNYLKTVIVHEVECKTCTDTNGSTTKSSFSKLTAITKLPKSLCFHIQRSAWGLTGNHKRTDYVVFSEILDMSSILRFQDVVKSALKDVLRQEGKTNGVSSSSVSGISPFPLRFYKSQYRLCAVISHCGAADSGHFITFRRGPVDKDVWFLTSDEDVLEVPLMAVFNSKAYMLFYELIEPNGTLSYC